MEDKKDLNLIRRFDELVNELMHRISNLGTLSRDRLLEKAHHIRLEPGKKLAANDWNRSLLYLLEGSLIRQVPGHSAEILMAGQHAVDQPLFSFAGSSSTKVTAREPSEILAFDRHLFELLHDEEQRREKAISIFDMDGIESTLFRRFTADHHQGRLDIPGVPEVAERIMKLANKPDIDLSELTRLVALDPALSARVVKVAVGSVHSHRGVAAAVDELGADYVRKIIFEYGPKAASRKHTPMVRKQMIKVHRHSVHVAAYCYELAKDLKGLSPGHAHLCGLLHDAGMFSLLHAADGYTDRIKGEAALDDMVWKLHGMIGGLVLGSWGFDNDFVAMAEEADDWHRDTSSRAPDYADVVVVAQLHSFVGSERGSRLPKFSDVPGFRKIAGKEPGPRFSMQLLQRTSPRILAVEHMLEGIF